MNRSISGRKNAMMAASKATVAILFALLATPRSPLWCCCSNCLARTANSRSLICGFCAMPHSPAKRCPPPPVSTVILESAKVADVSRRSGGEVQLGRCFGPLSSNGRAVYVCSSHPRQRPPGRTESPPAGRSPVQGPNDAKRGWGGRTVLVRTR